MLALPISDKNADLSSMIENLENIRIKLNQIIEEGKKVNFF